MRTIKSNELISQLVEALKDININIKKDVKESFNKLRDESNNELEQIVLSELIDNAEYAHTVSLPLCQDTGIVIAFVEIGNEVLIDNTLQNIIDTAVRICYKDNFFRKSIVKDPLNRINTMDNTPSIVHIKQVEGDTLKISLMVKGAGSENVTKLYMLNPTSTIDDIIERIVDSVKLSGSKSCPPIILGIGIGGDSELAIEMSKEALLHPFNYSNPNKYLVEIEHQIMDKVNILNIGPNGFGGKTCMRVFIETHPTHIAMMPLGITIQCHSLRYTTLEV